MKLDELFITSAEFARLFEVSRRTVENWKKDDGLPHTPQGIPFIDAFGWWMGRKNREMDALRGARIRREEARATREEIKAKHEMGELIPRGESLQWLVSLGVAAKLAFRGLPKRLAPIVTVETDEKKNFLTLQGSIDEIIRELGKPLKEMDQNYFKTGRR